MNNPNCKCSGVKNKKGKAFPHRPKSKGCLAQEYDGLCSCCGKPAVEIEVEGDSFSSEMHGSVMWHKLTDMVSNCCSENVNKF